MIGKIKAMQVSEQGSDCEPVEKDIPAPSNDEILIKVQACGVCHSDAFVKNENFPDVGYPRVPQHSTFLKTHSNSLSSPPPTEEISIVVTRKLQLDL